jgi:rhomboid family protein
LFPLRDSIAWTKRPDIVWTLIAINVAAFLYQISLNQEQLISFLKEYALIPRRYISPTWARENGLTPFDPTPLATNMFLHGGLLHIASNLWTLYIFGPALEERLGPSKFVALYIGAGLAASATHALFNLTSTVPALGASGAIAGIIAAYATKFPYAWIRILVLIVIFPVLLEIPALFFAVIWFVTQLMQGTWQLMMPNIGAGIAWWAHIGGFIAGYILIKVLDPGPAVAMPGIKWSPLGPRLLWHPSGRSSERDL